MMLETSKSDHGHAPHLISIYSKTLIRQFLIRIKHLEERGVWNWAGDDDRALKLTLR
jgi:hypothetical protein